MRSILKIKTFELSFRNNKFIEKICWFILITSMFLCFYHVLINAVDLPYADEFDLFIDPEMQKNLSLQWLCKFQSEASIVITRLLTWIFYHINGYNCKTIIIFNFIISCLGYFVLYKILKYVNKDFFILPLFFLPFFSDIFYMNRLISFQSQVYFLLLFCYLAIYFGFIKKKLLAAAFFISLSSISQAFVPGTAIFIILIINEFFLSVNKKEALKKLILPVTLITLTLSYCILGIKSELNTNLSNYLLPDKILFWRQAAHLILRGIFIERLNIGLLEPLTVLFSSIFFVFYTVKNKLYLNERFMPILGITAMFISLVFADCWGRSQYGFGILPWHFDYYIYIIPVIAVFLSYTKHYKTLLIYSLLLIYFHLPHFTHGYETFKDFGAENAKGAQCVRKSLNKTGEIICDDIYYSSDMSRVLKSAKKLNLHFIRENQIK